MRKESNQGGEQMEELIGLLRIRVKRGTNLAIRDAASRTSDPYVIVTMASQKLRARTVKNNCNPEWNDELTLGVMDTELPITLAVYDQDTFSNDDTMGEAVVDIKPYLECLRMGLEGAGTGTVVRKVLPTSDNCLADESPIFWAKGKLVQDMMLGLRNAPSGQIEIQIEWINIPGARGLVS